MFVMGRTRRRRQNDGPRCARRQAHLPGRELWSWPSSAEKASVAVGRRLPRWIEIDPGRGRGQGSFRGAPRSACAAMTTGAMLMAPPSMSTDDPGPHGRLVEGDRGHQDMQKASTGWTKTWCALAGTGRGLRQRQFLLAPVDDGQALGAMFSRLGSAKPPSAAGWCALPPPGARRRCSNAPRHRRAGAGLPCATPVGSVIRGAGGRHRLPVPAADPGPALASP